ncbi:DUF1835 domain-containing protein [Paenibacillus polygoni]|uniref:DUF1835 domain-containing protein n=1 Tax=Paenibacillus polygoni TaxID=3050112 RepID=A0ABY8WXB1_9BACL|nr:DUF1835 domain-containing protein [Paenibacillus polygoni]WIV17685.1 DUF1835 domain-containing protein [Paenibacillus polygoni]
MTNQHVHIMFGMEEQGILKAALHKAEIRHNHKVISFNDWFAFGPLKQLHLEEGEKTRTRWLSARLSNYEPLYTYNPEHQTGRVVETIQSLSEDTNVTLWHGNHAHDQIGVRFVLSLLRDRKMNMKLVNPIQKDSNMVGNVHTNPVNLSQLKASEYIPFLHKMDEFNLLTQEEIDEFVLDWEQISNDPALFRIWENDHVKLCAEDALDQDLRNVIIEQSSLYPDQYVPASKVVSEVVRKREGYSLRKDFLEYRLRSLIQEKQLLFKGAPGQLHRYRVKWEMEDVI